MRRAILISAGSFLVTCCFCFLFLYLVTGITLTSSFWWTAVAIGGLIFIVSFLRERWK